MSRKQNVHGTTWRIGLVVAGVIALVTACSATKLSPGTASSKSGVPTLLPTTVAGNTGPTSADPSGCSLLATAEQVLTASAAAQRLPTNPTSVIFTWKESGAAPLCVLTHGDAALARKLLPELEGAPADFTGTRTCPPRDGMKVALTFGSAEGFQTAIITLDGCPDVFLPDRPGAEVIADDVVRDLETTAPPIFLQVLQKWPTN